MIRCRILTDRTEHIVVLDDGDVDSSTAKPPETYLKLPLPVIFLACLLCRVEFQLHLMVLIMHIRAISLVVVVVVEFFNYFDLGVYRQAIGSGELHN